MWKNSSLFPLFSIPWLTTLPVSLEDHCYPGQLGEIPILWLLGLPASPAAMRSAPSPLYSTFQSTPLPAVLEASSHQVTTSSACLSGGLLPLGTTRPSNTRDKQMAKVQCKNRISKSQGDVTLPELSNSTTASLDTLTHLTCKKMTVNLILWRW